MTLSTKHDEDHQSAFFFFFFRRGMGCGISSVVAVPGRGLRGKPTGSMCAELSEVNITVLSHSSPWLVSSVSKTIPYVHSELLEIVNCTGELAGVPVLTRTRTRDGSAPMSTGTGSVTGTKFSTCTCTHAGFTRGYALWKQGW